MHLYWYIEHQRYLCFSINNKAVLDLLGDAGIQEEGSAIREEKTQTNQKRQRKLILSLSKHDR